MKMLAELQQRCQQAILTGNPTPGLFSAEASQFGGGFGVYLEAYHARLTAALRDNFPVLQRALGDEAFDSLARRYIDAHPSHFRSLRWFGDSLITFVATAPELLPHPALTDLARMDWATRTAFDAPDAPLLTLGDLAALQPEDWPGQRFKPVPSLHLIDLAWAVEPIWKALNDDSEATTEEAQRLPHVLLVWRPALDCCWRSADACEAAALRALIQGAPFAECCSVIARSDASEPAQAAASFLQRWIYDGLLAQA